MFKLIHIADSHWDQDKLEKCQASAAFIEQKCFELKPDLIVIAGDLQNRRQYLAGSSAVLPMMNHIIGLADCAPVAIVYGNAEHDPPGSLDFLNSLYTRHPVYVASRAETITLCEDDYHLWFQAHKETPAISKAILHLFPFPTKQWFLIDRENLSIDESNQLIQDALRKIFTGFGAVSMDAQCPVILVGHCNVAGAELSTGQTLLGQDVMVSKHDLELARADYYALGHIHKAQEIGSRMHYSGSIYHCNFGETEKKRFNFVKISVKIVPARSFQTFGGTQVPDTLSVETKVEQIEIPSRPLSLHELNWDPKDETWTGPSLIKEADWIGAELRVRVNATKEQQARVSDDDVKTKWYPGAYSYQIERIIIPEERIRSAEIVKAKTLPEKVVEWGRSIEKEISPEVLTLASEVERSVIS